eukprot:m.129663 g.129663  ORF g.129663 m.129663 type:complete len:498 (+) comp11270_c0_seq4:421-1914(+)
MFDDLGRGATLGGARLERRGTTGGGDFLLDSRLTTAGAGAVNVVSTIVLRRGATGGGDDGDTMSANGGGVGSVGTMAASSSPPCGCGSAVSSRSMSGGGGREKRSMSRLSRERSPVCVVDPSVLASTISNMWVVGDTTGNPSSSTRSESSLSSVNRAALAAAAAATTPVEGLAVLAAVAVATIPAVVVQAEEASSPRHGTATTVVAAAAAAAVESVRSSPPHPQALAAAVAVPAAVAAAAAATTPTVPAATTMEAVVATTAAVAVVREAVAVCLDREVPGLGRALAAAVVVPRTRCVPRHRTWSTLHRRVRTRAQPLRKSLVASVSTHPCAGTTLAPPRRRMPPSCICRPQRAATACLPTQSAARRPMCVRRPLPKSTRSPTGTRSRARQDGRVRRRPLTQTHSPPSLCSTTTRHSTQRSRLPFRKRRCTSRSRPASRTRSPTQRSGPATFTVSKSVGPHPLSVVSTSTRLQPLAPTRTTGRSCRPPRRSCLTRRRF